MEVNNRQRENRSNYLQYVRSSNENRSQDDESNGRKSTEPTLTQRLEAQLKSYRERQEESINAVTEFYSKVVKTDEDESMVITLLENKQKHDLLYYETRMKLCDEILGNLVRDLKYVNLQIEVLVHTTVESEIDRQNRYRKLLREKQEIRRQLQDWQTKFTRQIEETDKYIDELITCIENGMKLNEESIKSTKLTDRFPSERVSMEVMKQVRDFDLEENKSVQVHNLNVRERVLASMANFSSSVSAAPSEIEEIEGLLPKFDRSSNRVRISMRKLHSQIL